MVPAKKKKEVHGANPGEIVVHSLIETIEFVLGGLSHTASYLRLWALSLAHSQLAKVFFEKTIGGGIEQGNFLAILLGWPVFCVITTAVLMLMDSMECCLHALRLHWYILSFTFKVIFLLGLSFRASSLCMGDRSLLLFHLKIN